MYKISLEKRDLILNMIVRGSSARGIESIGIAYKNSIHYYIRVFGEACRKFSEETIKDLTVENLEVDEMWTFVAKKQSITTKAEQETFGWGDQYIFVAFDRKTKLVVHWMVGKRTLDNATRFMEDVKKRIINNANINTDNFSGYPTAIKRSLGKNCVHNCVTIKGKHANSRKVDTNGVERNNLTIRRSLGRLHRATNSFSRTLHGLNNTLSIYFYWYNFMRRHGKHRCTPAMEAKLTKSFLDWNDALL